MELFAEIVNGFQSLTISVVNYFRKKSSILDVWLGSEYASDNNINTAIFWDKDIVKCILWSSTF